MAQRTYLPTMVQIVSKLCVYTSRYDKTIREFLEPEAIPAYEALRVACDAFLAVVELISE